MMTEHVCCADEFTVKKYKEIQIPVPWGHIAAKAWGDERGRPVLGVHGILDNANTFDKLIPFLPQDLYFVAIDLAGHGRSSHRPPGIMYYHADYVMDVKRAADGLGWKKFSIFGHSLGAGVAFLFAGAFPEAVDKMVLLDALIPIPRPPREHGERLALTLQQMIKVEAFNKEDAKLYTDKDLIKRFLDGHKWCNEESAKVLIDRAVTRVDTPQGVKYLLTRDPRLKLNSPIYYVAEEVASCSPRIKCEVLYLRANAGIEHDGSFRGSAEMLIKFINDQLVTMKENCKKLEVIHVDGNHHTHLNTPENVAPHIVKFFTTEIHVASKL